MRTFKIFYSWQSDRGEKYCKDFIRKAAEAAAGEVGRRLGVEALVDAGTEGVSGTPAINETILRKIEECDIFLGDMTFVAATSHGKMLPNPNVMGEYGYALKVRGLNQILLAMNTAFGSPEELPFDLHHLRHPAQYTLGEGAPDGQRRQARTEFSRILERNIESVIQHLLKEAPIADPAARWDDASAAMAGLWNTRVVRPFPLVSAPKLVVCVVPLAALDKPQLAATTIKAARSLFPPSPDVRVEQSADENGWCSYDPPRGIPNKPNPEAKWCLRLLKPGFFEASVTIGERADDDPTIIVYGKDVERVLVNEVDRIAKIAHSIGLQGPALIRGSLEGIEDVQILRSRGGSGGHRIGRPSASLEAEELQRFIAPTADHLIKMIENIWLIGGWDDGSPFFINGHWTGYESN